MKINLYPFLMTPILNDKTDKRCISKKINLFEHY